MLNINYESAKTEVERLIEHFARLSARNRRGYNEPATRQEFILPLFRALGWNIEDTREVSPEERVSRGYVDFAFRLRDIPRFFVETKKIPENLEDPRWARQAINYAWLKGVTWAVLTDFEGLKVFNAEWQETLPARAIFKDLYWDEYVDRFDDLWLLSRPAMEEGALDRAAEAAGKKAKKTPVSRQLFADLTEWRSELFRHLRPYNPKWSIEQIDQAVQRILDRLIFIRTCEDREIEPYRLRPMLRQWRDQKRKKDLVEQLNLLFREFDRVYDTRLFAPHLCEELTSEPTPFVQIIEGLYQVPSGYGDYDFNAIDADVMGTIYEQYLGHRAQDPEGKQVVDKRAKRKAQGIYYTPQFVVRYIVGQTLGRLLEERDYEQARRVKVLDMACGSGSFLIEAFDVLDRYLAGVRGQDAASAAGDVHDLARRMEILTGNLYGVDLDAQAVEIARLNLLLKAVNQRGELPELTNIRQGNSLISGKPEELEAAFGPDWRGKQPFDWEEQFAKIMERGGFDVIVGNPPYFAMPSLPARDQRYFEAFYPEIFAGQNDILYYFIMRGLQLLKDSGLLGFIVSRYFLKSVHAKRFRQFILDHSAIKAIVDFQNVQLFEGVNVLTVIVILERQEAENLRQRNQLKVVKVKRWLGDHMQLMAHIESHLGENSYVDEFIQIFPVSQSSITADPWSLSPMSVELLKQKMTMNSWALASIFEIGQGMKTGRNAVFIVGSQTVKEYGLEPELLRRYVKTRDIKRYQLHYRSLYLLCLYKDTDIGQFPNAERYLRPFEAKLKERYQFKDGVCQWYSLSIPQNRELFEQDGEKIMTPSYSTSNKFAYDPGGQSGQFFSLTDTYVLVPKSSCPVSIKYVLGLLNSKALEFFHKNNAKLKREGYYEYFTRPLSQLPIHRINFDDPEDVARHDRMVEMVEEMLRLQKEHAEAEALKEDRRHDLARRIERLDAQIDGLVYELYGLTEEEVGVVLGRGV
jgi:type I restriction-modification system DNA methylase subunit